MNRIEKRLLDTEQIYKSQENVYQEKKQRYIIEKNKF